MLERGSIEGEIFHRGAVQALAPEEQRVTTRLATLVRKEFIRPDRSQLPGDDGFRFRHLLIRDAAYDALPKASRAELHERFAGWLLLHADDLVEADEVMGYHFEQAHRYRAELGQLGVETTALALRAGELLASASGRALLRDDLRAAVNLLARRSRCFRPKGAASTSTSISPTPSSARAGSPTPRRSRRRRSSGHMPPATIEASCSRSSSSAATCSHSTRPPRLRRVSRLAQAALPTFEAAGDDAGLAAAWHAIAYAEHNLLRNQAKLAAAEHGLEHAQRAGLHRYEPELRWFQASGTPWGRRR